MSVSTVPRAKAERLADLLASYPIGTSRRTGQKFWIVPSSNRLAAHWTALDGSGCTCRGYQHRGTCAHATAARLVAERQARSQQPAPAPTPGTRKLPSYEVLFPKCRDCPDLADGPDGRCFRCASDREYEQRLAARRAEGARLAAELPPFQLNPLAE